MTLEVPEAVLKGTAREQIEYLVPLLEQWRPHFALINNLEPVRAQLEKEVAELKAQRDGASRDLAAIQRLVVREKATLEQIREESTKARHEEDKAKAQAQQEVEAVTHKRDEALAERNRILQSVQAMLNRQQ